MKAAADFASVALFLVDDRDARREVHFWIPTGIYHERRCLLRGVGVVILNDVGICLEKEPGPQERTAASIYRTPVSSGGSET